MICGNRTAYLRGNGAVSKFLINRIAQVVIDVLVGRRCDAPANRCEKVAKILLNGRGAVALRVGYRGRHEGARRQQVGSETRILLPLCALRLYPENEITLDLPDMHGAGGGVVDIDAADRGIVPDIADEIERRALDTGVTCSDQ